MNDNVSDEIWEEGLSRKKSCSVNSRYKLIQFKVMHRIHYSKTRLNKIFPSISPQCDRSKMAEGTLAHLFWFCPILYDFWSNIFELFSSAYRINIQPDHSLAIFSYSDVMDTIPHTHQHALMVGLITAKKVILLNWKTSQAPCF